MSYYILIVDDDADDVDLVKKAASKGKVADVRIEWVQTGKELIAFLRSADTPPLLILCDMNLPGTTGFAVRDEMLHDKDLRYKSVPFLYWTTAPTEKQVRHAYDNLSQGVFLKPVSFLELQELIQEVVAYWHLSRQPKRL